jgi:predicted CXXCH cytochrome family protein
LTIGIFYLTQPSSAQGPEENAEFIGSRECMACHRDLRDGHTASPHALALRDAKRDPEIIIADFSQGDTVRTVQFPGENAPRPFTLEDIRYVIGSGRYAQRFVYETDAGEYRVFPAEWNVAAKVWQPFTLADSWDNPAYDWTANCAGCHTTGFNAEEGEWEEEGVQCEACHGAGSAHADLVDDAGSTPTEEEMVAIKAAIWNTGDAQLCGQCHLRGVDTQTGLPYPQAYSAQTNLGLEMELPPTTDTVHWWATGHAAQSNMQYNEWLLSGHGTALDDLRGIPEANDNCLQCHSADYRLTEAIIAEYANDTRDGEPPASLTLETAQWGVTCIACHAPHLASDTEFFLIEDANTLCLDCHTQSPDAPAIHHPVRQMFEGVALIEGIAPVASSHYTDENGPDCLTCHMPEVPIDHQERTSHTFQLVLPDGQLNIEFDSCTGCHTDISQRYMQSFVQRSQQKIRDRLEAAHTAIEKRNGVEIWVLEALDFVESDGSFGVHNYAYASALLDAVERELNVVPFTSTLPNLSDVPVNPTECQECHQEEYRHWQNSIHANSSLNVNFISEHAAQGNPSFCLMCHASGLNEATGSYAYEGVVCTSCHKLSETAKHPPGPVNTGRISETCGQCHSGAHAPTYNEWLNSDHKDAGVDCVDCHTPHDNGLVLETINDTCGDCHVEAMVDEVHMGEDMDCVDCHMNRLVANDGIHVLRTGHTMSVETETCSECHGDIHLLALGTQDTLPRVQISRVNELEKEVEALHEESRNNRNYGAIGGALGMAIVFGVLIILIRLRRAF